MPELGFGWNEKYAGSVGYRRLMREVFGQNIKAEGSERLYISRARLPNARGGILGEEIVEQNLAAQGYEIFHPEQHALEVQIARYKAARQVVALDGSALHLAAFFLNKGDRVAIVLRRSSANVADYVLQYRSFCSIDPDVVNCIQRDWIPEGSKRADYRSVGELDFEVLFGALKGLNYIESSFRPILPSAAEVHHMLGRVAQQRECAFTAINEAN